MFYFCIIHYKPIKKKVMADKLATVEEASTMLNVLSTLDPQKCITVSELEDMISQMTRNTFVLNYLNKSTQKSGMILEGNLVVLNMSGSVFSFENYVDNTGWQMMQVPVNQRVIATLSKSASISIPSSCIYVGLNSYSEYRYDMIGSHFDFSTSSWKWIIIFVV